MILKKIYLSNFRNFEKSTFDISPSLTLIIGENARGKTSLLEAIYTVIYGTGFRESREVELIKFDSLGSLIEAEFDDEDQNTIFQLKIEQSGENRVQKQHFVNKSKKTPSKYKSLNSQAVLFAPEQIRVITGSPSRKRKYFDDTISVVDSDYKKTLAKYENAFRRRNKVLENYYDELKLVAEIDYWDNIMVSLSSYIIQKRKEFVKYLNSHSKIKSKAFEVEYIADEFSKERLEKLKKKEYRLRRTLIGPQKDLINFYIGESEDKKNAGLFGSRSEQRMTLFWLKINEINLLEESKKTKPLLLLDDIFSELDTQNRKIVMEIVEKYQTIATTTEEEITGLAHIPEVVIRF